MNNHRRAIWTIFVVLVLVVLILYALHSGEAR